MTEKTLTTENIKPALDALRGELAPWPVVAKKQDRLNTAQLNAANSGITSSLVAQIIANTAAIRALESAITGTGLRPIVVASLPAIGTQGILYIVPVTTYDPATDADVVNYSNEYIWIVAPDAPVTEGYYEQVGQTGIVINNGQLTITVNGTSVGTFTANQSGDTTAAITVPTNADYVDLTTNQTVAGVKTFSSTIDGTAAKAIADEDGTSIKTGYVNVAGTQTVTGQKTWSGDNTYSKPVVIERNTDTGNFLALRNSVAELGSTPASATPVTIAYRDKNNDNLGYMGVYYDTDGSNIFRLYVRNKFTSGSPSTSGTADYTYFGLKLNADKSKEGILKASFRPYDNNSYSLGSSSYQWASVYAQSYYYNGTEFQSKFVTTDTSQTISGLKHFSSSILHKTPQTIDVSTNPADIITGKGLEFVDNTRYWGDIAPQWTTDGTFRIRIAMTNYNTSGTSTGWCCPIVLDFAKDGSKVDIWSTHSNSNLGTSTNKWKSLNGINPGALSLPAISGWVNIDTTNWDKTGADNSYTPVIDGWILLRLNNVTGNYIFVANSAYSLYSNATGSGSSWFDCFVPVRKDVALTIQIKGTNLVVARFYPCLGNV